MLPTRPRLAARSMCSSCATPLCITATRVSCGVTLIRISSFMRAFYRMAPEAHPRPGAGRQFLAAAFASGGNLDAEAPEQLRGLVQRQAHHAGIAAVDLGDERTGVALDAVGAGFVHGLAAGHVTLDLDRVERAKTYCGRRQRGLHALAVFERHAREHLVLPARQAPEKICGLGLIRRGAEDFVADAYSGVGRQHAAQRR